MTEITPKIATKIAQTIRKHHTDAASEEVLKYALIVLINTLGIILSVLVICLFTGHFVEGVMVLLAFAILRYVSGGVHLHSSDTCALISTTLLILLAHVTFPYWSLGFILNFLTVIIVFFLAPKGIEEVRKLKPSHLIIYKWLSIVIVCANFYFQSSLIALTFFAQALTLTTPIYFIVTKLERGEVS